MVKELEQSPELGLLGAEFTLGNPLVVIQYWKSLAHLYAYSKSSNSKHLPAWKAFNRTAKKGGRVGIYHSTYINMPAFGLAKIGSTQYPKRAKLIEKTG